jgi:hypothetical protein
MTVVEWDKDEKVRGSVTPGLDDVKCDHLTARALLEHGHGVGTQGADAPRKNLYVWFMR